MKAISAGGYRAIISRTHVAASVAPSPPLARRLRAILTVPAGEVFPSEQLLDHMPLY